VIGVIGRRKNVLSLHHLALNFSFVMLSEKGFDCTDLCVQLMNFLPRFGLFPGRSFGFAAIVNPR
tara:strand:- start:1741 stop:1935 length:195 start_codon:yes stop_codon:yes gene_type:complete